VNFDGTGHDGSSGKVISAKHADFFRGLGFDIPLTNSLESIDISLEVDNQYVLFLLEDCELQPEG